MPGLSHSFASAVVEDVQSGKLDPADALASLQIDFERPACKRRRYRLVQTVYDAEILDASALLQSDR